jgi:hypothetical protein
MKKVYNAYLASAIFCQKDQMFNAWLAEQIRAVWPDVNLYVPQENKSINDKTKCANSIEIYHGDDFRLKNTDILIAVIDGDVIPSGTSCEIGIFAEMCKRDPDREIIGLYTDCRDGHKTSLEAKNKLLSVNVGECQYSYANLFTVGALKDHGHLFGTTEEMLTYIKDKFNKGE